MPNTEQVELVVITPERQALEDHVDAVVIPAHDGELGVMRDRAPLMCELGIGQLRYTHGGQTWRMFIDGGFAQVLDNHVTVLTSRALASDQITSEVIADAERAVAAPRGHEPEARAAYELAQRRLSTLRKLREPTL